MKITKKQWVIGSTFLLVTIGLVTSRSLAVESKPPQSLDDQLLDDLENDLLDDINRPLPSNRTVPSDARRGRQEGDRPKTKQDKNAQEDPFGNLPPGVSETENPLLQIARQMREVQQRIDRNDSSLLTQATQQKIVAELEKLIEQAKKSCKKGQGQCKPKPSSKPCDSKKPKPGKSTSGSKPGTAASLKSAKENGVKQGSPSPQSALKEIWGELPPKVREKMLQLPVERFLPEYKTMVEEYFQRLSHDKQGSRTP